MSGVIVIVAYRPKPGKETELLELVRNRVPTLLKEGLVTDREPIIMRAREHFRKSGLRCVAVNITIVIRAFADGKAQFAV